MKPIPRPKTFAEFVRPPGPNQREVIGRILAAANVINEAGRRNGPANWLIRGNNLHDAMTDAINELMENQRNVLLEENTVEVPPEISNFIFKPDWSVYMDPFKSDI
jgi:hypothetical protein